MTVKTRSTLPRKSDKSEKEESQYLAISPDEIQKLQEESKKIPYKMEIVWRNVALFTALHFGAAIGLYQFIFVAKWPTVIFAFLLYVFGGFGITAGAHRLWSHKSYKAKLPMRIFLMLLNNIALQNDIIEWSRDHRCHHKWTDTDADPHNTTRGFFFAHMGWLLVRKHPQVKEQGAKLDLSDLTSDPVLMFQRRHYFPLVILSCFVLPTVVPVYFWGESALVAFYVAAVFRYTFTLHVTWCINSAAHYFGWKPYDHTITPVENVFTTIAAVGEGGHNFHHTFPQDYRTSEYSMKFNWTRVLIDTAAALGLVYDRRTAKEEIIDRQVSAKGNAKERLSARM
ncbi:unnamed protein product [Caenorhabditis bovis]|uniref:Fatty acid desaturase domain-containing protein n=1 Tax=Caenorhabditis bovis TaxID=2654633 RepID=A0A8S1FDE9_9PELO|nr:unnamed protein product [Caenorhabditis bovis]